MNNTVSMILRYAALVYCFFINTIIFATSSVRDIPSLHRYNGERDNLNFLESMAKRVFEVGSAQSYVTKSVDDRDERCLVLESDKVMEGLARLIVIFGLVYLLDPLCELHFRINAGDRVNSPFPVPGYIDFSKKLFFKDSDIKKNFENYELYVDCLKKSSVAVLSKKREKKSAVSGIDEQSQKFDLKVFLQQSLSKYLPIFYYYVSDSLQLGMQQFIGEKKIDVASLVLFIIDEFQDFLSPEFFQRVYAYLFEFSVVCHESFGVEKQCGDFLMREFDIINHCFGVLHNRLHQYSKKNNLSMQYAIGVGFLMLVSLPYVFQKGSELDGAIEHSGLESTSKFDYFAVDSDRGVLPFFYEFGEYQEEKNNNFYDTDYSPLFYNQYIGNSANYGKSHFSALPAGGLTGMLCSTALFLVLGLTRGAGSVASREIRRAVMPIPRVSKKKQYDHIVSHMSYDPYIFDFGLGRHAAMKVFKNNNIPYSYYPFYKNIYAKKNYQDPYEADYKKRTFVLERKSRKK
jgi:hypothetical protein